jgi:hypothetical protein
VAFKRTLRGRFRKCPNIPAGLRCIAATLCGDYAALPKMRSGKTAKTPCIHAKARY